MENVTDNSPETESIRQRMEEVRCDLDEGVQDIVEGARDMGEWRSYVRSYPWVCLGAALTVGYLIIPRRAALQPDTQSLAELANQIRLLATAQLSSKGNLRGTLLGLVGDLVIRQVSSFVGQQAGKLFAAEPAQPPQPPQEINHEEPHS